MINLLTYILLQSTRHSTNTLTSTSTVGYNKTGTTKRSREARLLAETEVLLEPIIAWYDLRNTHKGREVPQAVALLLNQNLWYRKTVKRQQKIVQDMIEAGTIPNLVSPPTRRGEIKPAVNPVVKPDTKPQTGETNPSV